MTIIIIPAAGESTRFMAAGYKKAKPWITFARHEEQTPITMLEHVLRYLDPLPREMERRVVMASHHSPKKVVQGVSPVMVRDSHGQAESVMAALSGDQADDDVIVMNVDAVFNYPIKTFYEQVQHQESAALVFKGGKDLSYSYVDGYPLFYRACEKDAVSPWAMAGLYYFRSVSAMKSAWNKQQDLQVRHNGEFYLSGLMTCMKSASLAVCIPADDIVSFGTPELLNFNSTFIPEGQ